MRATLKKEENHVLPQNSWLIFYKQWAIFETIKRLTPLYRMDVIIGKGGCKFTFSYLAKENSPLGSPSASDLNQVCSPELSFSVAGECMLNKVHWTLKPLCPLLEIADVEQKSHRESFYPLNLRKVFFINPNGKGFILPFTI